ncbi:hypothetical protein CHLRE_04g217973v5 [Chlamydomonas reinhardtii]|uniref:Uncharacterized protein n=1 Tax=Chlamydomonas reinhardtii TaxID=3055 RepID=A0A2K3DTM3_CHLRE|nr:uncharacterized protein CHLRE_04g217973v5 [Chlamydomonas reinhardtii]PNW83877.1 hypothetical protein CHLRE_04g217973v5 [Chlamydomonas reinhardtii]
MAYISSRSAVRGPVFVVSRLQVGLRADGARSARRACALSRGWMVSSPQGMELATVAMASQSG